MSALPQPKTDAIVEGVPMRGAIVEYREAQVAALEKFAGEQERAIGKLVDSLRLLADAVRTAKPEHAGYLQKCERDAAALLRELGEAS